MKKTRRAVLAWLLVFAFIFTGPGVGVAAATAGLREEPVAESDKDLSEIVLEDVTLDAEAKELPAQKELIMKVMKEEEDSFLRTLENGIKLLSGVMEETKAAGKTEIAGDKAFTLFDTFGFPLDLTELICRETA